MALRTHDDDTNRLTALSGFLSAFAPRIGMEAGFGQQAEDLAPPEIIMARDRAILDAFAAVGQIARDSSPAGLTTPASKPTAARVGRLATKTASSSETSS